MTDTITLYRPVGEAEYKLIEQSGFKRFPPRLPGQPIFYPVLSVEYACKISQEWNLKNHGCSFVTEFEVSKEHLRKYEVHQVGGKKHEEYWIPAAKLPAFNAAIVGPIRVVATHSKL